MKKFLAVLGFMFSMQALALTKGDNPHIPPELDSPGCARTRAGCPEELPPLKYHSMMLLTGNPANDLFQKLPAKPSHDGDPIAVAVSGKIFYLGKESTLDITCVSKPSRGVNIKCTIVADSNSQNISDQIIALVKLLTTSPADDDQEVQN